MPVGCRGFAFRLLGFRVAWEVLGFIWALEYHTLILFSLKGTIMKTKFILFLPGYLKAQLWLFKSCSAGHVGSDKFASFTYSCPKPRSLALPTKVWWYLVRSKCGLVALFCLFLFMVETDDPCYCCYCRCCCCCCCL